MGVHEIEELKGSMKKLGQGGEGQKIPPKLGHHLWMSPK